MREHEWLFKYCKKEPKGTINMSKIYVVMGKSSTGKDTIYKQLLGQKNIELKAIVGYTTRPIRCGEKEGEEYFFVTEDELIKLQKAGKVIEHRAYNTVYGVWNYFTVDDGRINLDKNDYIMIGTLEAYDKIKEYYGTSHVEPVYLEVENGLRLKRALEREQMQKEPRYSEMCRRYLADEEDFSEEKIIASGIEKKYENIDMQACLTEIIENMATKK